MDGNTDKLGEQNDRVETELIPNCFCFLYNHRALFQAYGQWGGVDNFGNNTGNDFKAYGEG